MRSITVLLGGALLLGGCASPRTTSTSEPHASDAALEADVARAVEAAEPIETLGDLIDAGRAPAEPEPSLIGFERSHWPTIVVHPESGTVRHTPAYLGGQSRSSLEGVDLSQMTTEQRAEFALSPAYAGSRWTQALWEPVRFAGQVLMLPATLVGQAPFSRTASPARGGSAAAASSPQRGGLTRGQGATGQPASGSGVGPGETGGAGAGAGGAGGGR